MRLEILRVDVQHRREGRDRFVELPLEVLVPSTKEFVTLRVPYPLGFFARSATGRIDDPNTGWKGKGLWSSYSTYAAWHIEGGKGALQKAVKFQMRPDPLAK